MANTFLFTSESVTEGHPDKLCDVVSDTILDACLAQDSNAKVACETVTKTGLVMLLGEITTTAQLDYQTIVRDAVKKIGYNSSEVCFDASTCSVLVGIQQQSIDIAKKVHLDRADEDIGAGDQGIMFGYATDETETMMPLTHELAHRLARRLTNVRKEGIIPYLGPDGKTQVTIEYERNGAEQKPKRIHTVLISTMHRAGVDMKKLYDDVKLHVIDPVLEGQPVDAETKIIINPGGDFIIGGPLSDAGLTGRKIIVDGYGGWGAHGGGAFSGKDPSKVDRSASYAARWVAKSVVAAGLAKRCLVQLAYAIGVSEPISIFIDTYGTGTRSDVEILDIVKRNFKLTPGNIIKELDLRRPIYAATASGGHFGRMEFPWEHPKALQL